MNCDSGSHRFRPFKRSRDLYCIECGDLRLSPVPALDRAVIEQDPPHVPAPVDEVRDPYLDAAKGIVEAKVFEREIDRILDEAGAIGPIRERLKFEATQFGPTLDLATFAKYAQENVEALPVETPMEDLIGEFGGEG